MRYTPKTFFFWFIVIAGLTQYSYAQVPSRWSERMAKSVIVRHSSGLNNWDYVNGTYLEGIEEVWRLTKDPVYYDYIKSCIDAVIEDDGAIKGYNMLDYNLDEIKEGTLLLFLYKNTGEGKYLEAARTLRAQLGGHPRTNEGGFWHKQRYPWQMWLDGLYMGSPFYSEYGILFNEPEDIDDVVHQITQMEKHGRDSVTGLLYHGWDESREQSWADPVTGQSPSFWGRGMGWYAMAIVDVLDYMPVDHADRDSVIGILRRMSEAIATCQDPVKKVWWQVLDRGGDVNNYTESSVSCMFVYALAKAVRLGYVDESYRQVAVDGFNGILDEFIEDPGDGTIDLTKTCTTAGLGSGRNGSYEYYTQVALHRTNDGKGEGPFILAAAEIEMMDSLYPVALLRVDTLSEEGLTLAWSQDPLAADSILIERNSGSAWTEIGTVAAMVNTFTDTSTLIPGTTYEYRVTALNDSMVSSASIPVIHIALNEGNLPLKAADPMPGDSARNVSVMAVLNWNPGAGSSIHRIHLGETDPPSFITEQTGTSFEVELEYNKTYYWRIDEGNENGVTEGDTWLFTTRLDDTLVGYWTFDESSGDQVADGSGFGNNGSIVNMLELNHTQGIKGGAIYLSGGEYIRIPHQDVLNFGEGDFTIAFYTLLDPMIMESGEEYRFVLKGSHLKDEAKDHSGKRYEVYLNTDADEFRFAVDDDITKSSSIVAASGYLGESWLHITVVRRREFGQLKLYIDGTTRNTVTDNTGDIDQQEDLLIGYSEDFPVFFQGTIDELRIYNFALSNSEIKNLLIPVSASENIYSASNYLTYRALPGENLGSLLVRMPGEAKVYLDVYDMTGRRCLSLKTDLDVNGMAKQTFSTEQMESGIYIITASGSNSFGSVRVIIE